MTDFSLEFEDDKELEETQRLLENYVEGYQYECFTKQSDEDPHFDWGEDMNLLIMSDRCPGRSKGLCEYLKTNTNLSSIKRCETLEAAKDYIQQVPINILVFVGYQENQTNYEIKKILKEKDHRLYTVMYAFLDSVIERYCTDHKIKYAFSSTKPAAEFIDYLDITYSLHEFFLAEGIDDEEPADKQRGSGKMGFLVG